jgi:hypothetical protein
MSKQLKAVQFRNLRDYSKKLVELVKDGYDVQLDHCIAMFGKLYTIKYYDKETVEDTPKSGVVAYEVPAEVVAEAEVSEEAKEPVVQEEVVEAEKAAPVAKPATKPAAKKASAKV